MRVVVWNKFRQLVPLLTNKDISLTVRGRLYSSCVQSSMLHASEIWPVRKENPESHKMVVCVPACVVCAYLIAANAMTLSVLEGHPLLRAISSAILF